jgi:hypothetical protein
VKSGPERALAVELMSAMVIRRADSTPLYKPMNSLAEKGVFRFAVLREMS